MTKKEQQILSDNIKHTWDMMEFCEKMFNETQEEQYKQWARDYCKQWNALSHLRYQFKIKKSDFE